MAMNSDGGDLPERPGNRPCQYFLRTGTCIFGATCNFDHPRDSGGSLSNVPLQYHGYPQRLGERECFYYMRMGYCIFGISCQYHHPEPPNVHTEPTTGAQIESIGISAQVVARSFYPTLQTPSVLVPEPTGTTSTNFRMPMLPPLSGSYVSGAYGPILIPNGLIPLPGWTSYSMPMSPMSSPSAQPSVGAGSLYGVTSLPVGPYSPMMSPISQSSTERIIFPERPGQPECQFYLRTGDCRYGPSCIFHHPLERPTSAINGSLSPLGLPLRPGERPCPFYMRHGFCRFGSTCKFHHPMERSSAMRRSSEPSRSSLPLLPTSLSPNVSPQISSSEATSTSLGALTLSETTPPPSP